VWGVWGVWDCQKAYFTRQFYCLGKKTYTSHVVIKINMEFGVIFGAMGYASSRVHLSFEGSQKLTAFWELEMAKGSRFLPVCIFTDMECYPLKQDAKVWHSVLSYFKYLAFLLNIYVKH